MGRCAALRLAPHSLVVICMNMETDISTQVNVAGWINENLSIPYSFENDNETWSHPCFDMVTEHHAAIISLCQSQLYGSALALLRVELEALVRGLWLRHVADEKDIAKYKKDKIEPKFYELVESVESTVGASNGVLSYIKDSQWSIFNSFTHTGIEAVSRRIGESTTGYDNYKETDVVKALRLSGLFAVFAAIELASLSKNESIINSAFELANKYGK